MNIQAAFPSTYLKTADLQGQQVQVSIAKVQIETIGQGKEQEDCPVMYFDGKQKGMVLNKTNAGTIAAHYGDETDAWIGRTITIYPTVTNFGGRQVECMRVRCNAAQVQHSQIPEPPRAAPQQAPVEPALDANTEVGAPTGDGIPFSPGEVLY